MVEDAAAGGDDGGAEEIASEDDESATGEVDVTATEGDSVVESVVGYSVTVDVVAIAVIVVDSEQSSST